MRLRLLLALLVAALTTACTASVDTAVQSAVEQNESFQPATPTAEPTLTAAPDAELESVERAAIQTIFDDMEQRWDVPAGDTGDLASGGPCPFGDSYGQMLLEQGQVLCIDEEELIVHLISELPLLETLGDDLTGDLEPIGAPSAPMEAYLIEIDFEPFLLVQTPVEGFSVGSAAFLQPGQNPEELAAAFIEDLERTAAQRAQTLSTTTLTEILDTADEIFGP